MGLPFKVGEPCPNPDCRQIIESIFGEPGMQYMGPGYYITATVNYIMRPCHHVYVLDVRPKPKPLIKPQAVVVPFPGLCGHPGACDITAMGDSHEHHICINCGNRWFSRAKREWATLAPERKEQGYATRRDDYDDDWDEYR